MRFVLRSLVFISLIVLYLLGQRGLITSLPQGGSPFLFLASLCAGTLVWTGAVIAVFLLGAALLNRRFFCRYCCPMGFCFDLLVKVREKWIEQRTIKRFPNKWRYIGVLLLLLTLLGMFWPILGTGIFLQLDPLVIFGAIFQLNGYNVLLVTGGLLLVLAYCAPWFWCGNFCPLGAIQDILTSIVRWWKKRKACSQSSFFNNDSFYKCPVLRKMRAGRPRSQEILKTDYESNRRSFLLFMVIGTSFALFLPITSYRFLFQRMKEWRKRRPPGAVEEPLFSNLCAGCGRCITACPTNHLVPDTPRFDRTEPPARKGWSDCTPSIGSATQFAQTYCEKDCIACGAVCPTGAIRSFTLEEKKGIKLGSMAFHLEECLLYYQKECRICQRECPYDAIEFVWSEEEYTNLPKIDDDKCTGCERCTVFCPGIDSYLDEDSKVLPQHSKTKGLQYRS